MKILISYRAASKIRGWETGSMLAKAFRSLGHEVDEYAKIYQDNTWLYDPLDLFKKTYDLLFYCEMNDSDPQYLELKHIKTAKRAGAFFDISYYVPGYIEHLSRNLGLQYNFIANPFYLNGFANSHFLPYACDIELHGRSVVFPKKYDFGLVGSIREDRLELKSRLAEHNIDLTLLDNVYRGDYINALASCRVIINQNPPAGRGLLNMRVFETMAAGSVLLNNSGDFIETIATPTIDCLTYDDISDLVYQCKTLKSQPNMIESLAKTGQENVFCSHTYVERCKQILNAIL